MSLSVRPYPGEQDRWLVQSGSRPEVEHVVDANYVECPGDMATVHCGCEENHIKGQVCSHIIALAEYLKTNL